MPSRPLPTRGITSATSRGALAHAIASATVAKARDRLERLLGRRQQLQGCAARERLLRRDPELLDELGAVVRRRLRCRRGGDEEARVEALRPAERRQPVAEIDETFDRKAKSLGGAEVDDALLAAVQRDPPRREPRGVAAVEVDERVAVAAREQQPRFLEALADRGDPVGEAAAGKTEPPARLVVAQAIARAARERVARLDDAARKNPRAAVVVASFRAPGQQHLDAARAVAQHDDRRRRPRRPLAAGGTAALVAGSAAG
jgi:hypothetical protein